MGPPGGGFCGGFRGDDSLCLEGEKGTKKVLEKRSPSERGVIRPKEARTGRRNHTKEGMKIYREGGSTVLGVISKTFSEREREGSDRGGGSSDRRERVRGLTTAKVSFQCSSRASAS